MGSDLEKSALDWLGQLAEQTGAFRISRCQADGEFDWKLKIRPAQSDQQIPVWVAVKSRMTPREFQGFRQQKERHDSREPLILCCPRISPRVAEMCREAGISYLDSAGNCRIAMPGLFLHIEGRELPAPPQKAADLFAPKSSRIVRILLSDVRRGWQVQELAKEADVSLGLASRIRSVLLEQAYAEVQEGLLYAQSPSALLDAWQSQYKLPERSSLYVMDPPGKVESKIESWAKSTGRRSALTGFSGAWHVAPMVRHSVLMVYLDSTRDAEFEELLQTLQAKPVDSGANLSIWFPADEFVFYARRSVKNRTIVSPLQLYLDLSALHGRGEEAAQEILERELKPQWPT